MLGLPDTYTEPWTEEDLKRLAGNGDVPDKEKHPAEYNRCYDYDIFNFDVFQQRDRLKRFLKRVRERQGEFEKIKAAQAKLGDKWEESDRFLESFIKRIKSSTAKRAS